MGRDRSRAEAVTVPETDDPRARFAAALSRLRESGGWSGYALARAAGISPILLTRMERGVRDPQMTTLLKLADVLGCTLDELCGRDAP